MNVLEVIVLVMVVTIVVTITLAATSYAAFRVRERRRPTPEETEADAPLFFERVRFPGLVERSAPGRSAVGSLGLGLDASQPDEAAAVGAEGDAADDRFEADPTA